MSFVLHYPIIYSIQPAEIMAILVILILLLIPVYLIAKGFKEGYSKERSGKSNNHKDGAENQSSESVIAEKPTNFKNSLKLGVTLDDKEKKVGLYLSEVDRASHIYVVGSTGVGKSKALATWVLDDLQNGRGCAVIDPHGDLISDIVAYGYAFLEDRNLDNVILVDFTDPELVVGFNPLEPLADIDPYTQTLELVEVFRKIWNLDDATAPRLLEILRNSIYTLMEAGGTMLDIELLLTNKEFRESMIRFVKNEAVVSFWRNRFDRWKGSDQTSFVESTLNKVSTFNFDPRIRLMLSSKKSTINFRAIMDEGKALLVNLSKGVLRTNSFLLGALFVAKVQMAAMSRQNIPHERRRPFYFYVDEFQDYTTFSFAEILSEARKYGLCLTLAHQNLEQIDEQLRSIILANANNFICFRMDRQDAELLVRYMTNYDPFALKMIRGDNYDYYDMKEQWELFIEDLTSVPTQNALLKTKGKEPIQFAPYGLGGISEFNCFKDSVSQQNQEQGYLLSIKELEENLVLQASSFFEPDEPESFQE